MRFRAFATSLMIALLAAAMAQTQGFAAAAYRTLGQPDLASDTLATRCANADARFTFSNAGGFDMHGPSGITADPRGRLYVTDYGGNRVLTWPNMSSLTSCQPADAVIGAAELNGPESVAFDPRNGTLFVASTLSHTVIGYKQAAGGGWSKFVTLGKSGVSGTAFNRFKFPRGLAVDANGRLFVADDFNRRVLIFDAPFSNGESAVDSISASANGGFASPKGLAMSGQTLFVADFDNNRVLRFTGPFVTPDKVYAATGEFRGTIHPVDVAVHPNGALLVTDQQNRRIARYDDAISGPSAAAPQSAFADHIGLEPLGVAADRNGSIYVADYRNYRVLIRDEAGLTRPVNAGLSTAARNLLSNLHKRAGLAQDRVAIGQQLITWKYGAKSKPGGWYGDWLQLKQAGLPLPELMGGETSDLMTYPGFSPNTDALAELIRHGKSGHMVTLVWHPDNPVAGGDFSTPIATDELRRMTDGGNATGARWLVQLDRAAAVLQKFEDANVPVLFRPLHEQNGDFFWWGHGGQSGASLAARQRAWSLMWRHMVKHLTVDKGLSNVIFVFGTNQVNYDGVAPPLTYYPGGKWADAVSIDVYDEELDMGGSARGLQHYAALVGTGKPFGLAEFGQSYGNKGTGANAASWDSRTLVRRVIDSYPRTVFAVSWYSSVEGNPLVSYVLSIADTAFTDLLLTHPLIDTQ
jgi:DNA-binding beta-propeller fold protein YncE